MGFILSVVLFLLNSLLVYAEKCLFPNVLYLQYVNLHCCCASKILHDDSGLVCCESLLNCQGIKFPGRCCMVLGLLPVSGDSQLTEAKYVKPKHFMGSLFDARIHSVP